LYCLPEVSCERGHEDDRVDTEAVLPFYAYLAATSAFLENHCAGFGTNSTANHLLIVGGQSPTLRNPPQPEPEWDMPSLPGQAQDNGLSWKVYAGSAGYPVNLTQPAPPSPPPAPAPPPPGGSVRVGPVLLRDGSILPPPHD
jgi:hypothetical protein